MKALLHYASMYDLPEGIWWREDGVMRRVYTNRYLETVGLNTMLHRNDTGDPADTDDLFVQLSEKTPYPDSYEVIDIEDGVDPAALLTTLQSQATREIRRADRATWA